MTERTKSYLAFIFMLSCIIGFMYWYSHRQSGFDPRSDSVSEGQCP